MLSILTAGCAFSATTFRPPLGDLQVTDTAARWALDNYQSAQISGVEPIASTPIATTFCRAGEGGGPRLLFLHGADSNALEWRFVIRSLSESGYDCTSLDWWSGGFTERGPITRVLEAQPTPPRPWEPIRSHIHAFWKQQLDAEPVVLVGTSLGGAVATDFAVAHPEAVKALILVDAGGQSFKSPDPDTVTALAPVVSAVKTFAAFVQARVPDEGVRLVALHRSQPGWREAAAQYYRSGSYKRLFTPPAERIRQVPQRTLVLWGEEDPIIPVEDAYAFQRDLQDCAAVHVIPGAGHSPHLETEDGAADAVIARVREFVDAL